MRLLTPILLATVLVACGGEPTPTNLTQPATDASLASPSVATPQMPDAPLGTFDLDRYRELFDTTFTTANVTDSNLIRFVAAFDFPRGLDVMVDPDDAQEAIVQTGISFGLDDPDMNLFGTWLGLFEGPHPEATAWLRGEVEDYLAAPGAEISLHEQFGEVCASLFTLGSALNPAEPASTLGAYFEQAEFRGPGCT